MCRCFAHLPSASFADHDYQAALIEVKCSFAQLGWPITSICEAEEKQLKLSQLDQLENALTAEAKRNKDLETRMNSLEVRMNLLESGIASSIDRIRSTEWKIDEADDNRLSSDTTRIQSRENAEKIDSQSEETYLSDCHLIAHKKRLHGQDNQESKFFCKLVKLIELNPNQTWRFDANKTGEGSYRPPSERNTASSMNLCTGTV